MKSSEIFQKIEDICNYLNSNEWRFNQLVIDEGRKFPELIGNKGARVICQPYGKEDRICLFGTYPQTIQSFEQASRISFCLHRDSRVIARDIKKRFLDEYQSTFQKSLVLKHQEEMEIENKRLFIHLLNQHCPLDKYQNGFDSNSFHIKNFYGRIQVNAETMNFECRFIPRETAFKALALINDDLKKKQTI